jgi:hypothetical protein
MRDLLHCRLFATLLLAGIDYHKYRPALAMTINSIFDGPLWIHIACAILHFLWQSAVIAGAAAVVAWLLRHRQPAARHSVHLVALSLMLLCLPTTLGVLVLTGTPPGILVSQPGPESAASVQLRSVPVEAEPSVDVSGTTPSTAIEEPSAASGGSWADSWAFSIADWAPWIVSSYVLGVLVMLGRLLLAVHGGRRLRRDAVPVEDPSLMAWIEQQVKLLRLRTTSLVAYCDRVAVPVLVGILRPTIFLPASLATGLSPGQLQLVIAHELAHLTKTRISQSRITDRGLEHLAQAESLTELFVMSSKMTDAGLHHLRALRNLESLELVGEISGVGLERLVSLSDLKKLRLGGPNLGDAALSPIGRMTTLEELKLSGKGITAAGVRHLQDLDHLERLELHGRWITDETLAPLASVQDLETLQLSLPSEDLTVECLRDLAQRAQLEKLVLRSTQFERKDLLRRKAALPKCEIDHR